MNRPIKIADSSKVEICGKKNRMTDAHNRIICYYEVKTGWIFIKFNKDLDEYVIERDISIKIETG